MSTSSIIVTVVIVVGLALLGGSVYWATGMIARLRGRYQDLSRQILAIHQDVAVMRETVAKIQETVARIQEVTVQLERHMVLEQLSDLVRLSTNEGIVDQAMASNMLKHIGQLRHDALSTERVSY